MNELLEYVTAQLPLLTSRPDLVVRHFPAQALARHARLVRAMTVLADNGFLDVVQVLARTALETFALGIYALHGGEEAYSHVIGDHVRARRLVDWIVDDATPEEPEWDGPTDRINWEDLILRRLPALVREHEGQAAEAFFEMLYNQAYRAGSMFGTHASLGTIGMHREDTEAQLQIREIGWMPDDGSGAIIIAGSELALLAERVFRSFGVDPGPALRLYELIVSGVDGELVPLDQDP